MKKVMLLIPLLAFTAACENQNDSTLAGAAAGAALGAAVSDDDRVEGALIGGAAGAVVGTLIGQASTPGDCIYRDAYGNRYIADCP
ncbi:glycine zipper 2TM domain-containing protein [Defluviimonas sp. WL0002]|uniref:Glycine zipper 2TM domain-containing protein n=1 Tax=Albidovulum marisflavi TaxID=2984159 RepID=A0ABT2ZCN6_9RHOB|nr:YMGG-like glycine zipper-containing protein [Defluviimonas sp. WL0002]MCV2868847.1 glycine zipper 2TM domain-containing protein [Defluviimonas sp. WL0002]